MCGIRLGVTRIVTCVVLALGVGAGWGGSAALGQSGERPRNILLLMCDHFRFDAAGYAGNPYAVTPNLDKLAASGTIFTRAYCQNPLCVPSRTSILTGKYCRTTGVRGNQDVVSRDHTSFTQVLRASGFKTACFGKLHVENKDGELTAEELRPARGGGPGRP